MPQELASKARVVEDVLAAMQAEERAKLDAQHEARIYRGRMAELEVSCRGRHAPPCQAGGPLR